MMAALGKRSSKEKDYRVIDERKSSDPLKAVPYFPENVNQVTVGGKSYLKRGLEKGEGFKGFLAKNFGMEKAHQVELDAVGSYYVSQVDGKRNLQQIVKLMSKHFEFENKECNEALVKFTADLMKRGMIALHIDGVRLEKTGGQQ